MTKTTPKCMLSWVIALAMIFAMLPVSAFASDGDPTQSGTITGFTNPTDITVESGTAQAEIPFPETVTATVAFDVAATPAQLADVAADITISVGAWQLLFGEYDPNTADRYVFEAVRESMTLPAGITLPEDFEELPCVAVDVGEVEIGFAPMSVNIGDFINSLNSTFSGNGLTAAPDGISTVNITGACGSASDHKAFNLALTIPAGVTVNWNADLYHMQGLGRTGAPVGFSVIEITEDSGAGSKFIMSGGTVTTSYSGESAIIYNASDTCILDIRGGNIIGGSGGTMSTGIANGGAAPVNINGGTVRGGDSEQSAGIANFGSGAINVTTGTVCGGNLSGHGPNELSVGIANLHGDSTLGINITDGNIYGGASAGMSLGILVAETEDGTTKTAINVFGGNVYGGEAAASFGINSTGGSITVGLTATVKGGTASQISGGIYSTGTDASADAIIVGGNAVVNGGTAPGSVGILGDVNITVGEWAKVINYSGLAIGHMSSKKTVAIGGHGVVFGKDADNAIQGGATIVGDDGIVITWTGDEATYAKGTTTDLKWSNASTREAKWDIVDGKSGISYKSNGFPGFIEILGITVTGGDDGGGGGGGGGGSSSQDRTPAPAPDPWLEPAPAQTKAGDADKSQSDIVRTKSTGTYGVRKGSWQNLKGYTFSHDTMEGRAVAVRVTISNPAAIKTDALVSAYVKGDFVENRKAFFEKWFGNEIRIIHMDETKPWGQDVRIAAKVDLAKMDTGSLYFYSYDKATNKYIRITAPQYKIDKNGYLHFTTPFAGDIVISENPLERR